MDHLTIDWLAVDRWMRFRDYPIPHLARLLPHIRRLTFLRLFTVVS